ncbi:MAG: TolC family protein [Gammaproteobacteria bacterium]|nr:TolC family protein [Gammaproteobacteria bacterium]
MPDQLLSFCAILILFAFSQTVVLSAENKKTALPEPLTLDYALSLSSEATPRIQIYQADIDAAKAGLKHAESLTGFNSALEARANWIDPADSAPDQTSDDHRFALTASQTLYDFGRSNAAESSARFKLEASRLQYLDANQKRRIEIMRRYFDVILADLQFYRYNEEMATTFISMNRTQDRRELGQASDIDVLEKRVESQRIRHLRYQSQNEQRRTRALLAVAINRPSQLSKELARPQLEEINWKLAEVEDYQQQAQLNNPALKASQLRVSAAEQKVKEARARYNPSLKGRVEAYTYSRDRSSYDNWRAGITLEVPLTTGGESDAGIAQAQSLLYREQAHHQQTQLALSRAILETWLEIDALRFKLDEMKANSEYRELYLDRSRALYEMEVKTDLGDAMVRVSEAERNLLTVEYNMAIAWARLAALTGQDKPLIKPNTQKPSEN